jgi:hypothetical protein
LLFQILNILLLNKRAHKHLLQCNGLFFMSSYLNYVINRLSELSLLSEAVAVLEKSKTKGRLFSVISERNVLRSVEEGESIQKKSNAPEKITSLTDNNSSPDTSAQRKSGTSAPSHAYAGSASSIKLYAAKGLAGHSQHKSTESSVSLLLPSSPEDVSAANKLNYEYMNALLYLLWGLWSVAGYEANVESFLEEPGIVTHTLDVLENDLCANERKIVIAATGLLSCLAYDGVWVDVGVCGCVCVWVCVCMCVCMCVCVCVDVGVGMWVCVEVNSCCLFFR